MTRLSIAPQALNASLQEAKEAVADALVNMTIARCSGIGEFGRIVYGRSPQRAFVSGFLLPRFAEIGDDDETSDIHIAVVGLDLQVTKDATGTAVVRPWFSVYVRVLPEWSELVDRRLGIQPTFDLIPAVRKEIVQKIRDATKARCAEEGLVGRDDPKSISRDVRRQRQLRRTALKEETTKQIYKEYGIESAGLPEREDNDSPEAIEGPTGQETPIDAPPPEREVSFKFVWGDHHVPSHLARPADIPIKWKRIDVTLPVLHWELDARLREAELVAFEQEMAAAVTAQVDAWLSSPEGQAEAWRDETVQPTDVANEATWKAFLERIRKMKPDPQAVRPPIDEMRVTVQDAANFANPDVRSVRVALENNNRQLSKKRRQHQCASVFAAGIEIDLPEAVHKPLIPDRIEPSYRFRHHMEYPAIGLNNGITASVLEGRLKLATTWSPRFIQIRIVPLGLGVPVEFSKLSADGFNPDELLPLPAAYRTWIDQESARLKTEVRQGLSPDDAAFESERLAEDIAAWSREAGLIERGIKLLIQSRRAYLDAQSASDEKRAGLLRQAAPYRAWLLMNRALFDREKGNVTAGWRLFQMAFVLAHLPTIASRMTEFADWHDPAFDEEAATLLYFATGGGKSEAFYGILVFGLFLDRLRGKERGVTALVRYPLRLLTLQQAQRLFRLLIQAELIRKTAGLGDWPFEVGFWVGSANTPNNVGGIKTVPAADDETHRDDDLLKANVVSPSASDKDRDFARGYADMRVAYCKISTCPICQEETGLRLFEGAVTRSKRVGIVCFNDSCAWNKAHPGEVRTPLPFLLTDDTIYQRAPSVVLGTVDKLAMIGQHPNTITNVLGMFGTARWMASDGHLFSPRPADQLASGPDNEGYEPVFPAYQNGRRIFKDPFPSIVIQDEMHLLEESLGTFSGLFETTFETLLGGIDQICGKGLEAARSKKDRARMPKIIAATATVSDPDKQLAVLYQRKPLQFPHPGPDLYRSFYAAPADPPAGNADRQALEGQLGAVHGPQAAAPWMRLFCSLMTNGASHTVTTVAALSAFHVCISEVWEALLGDQPDRALQRLESFISPRQDGDWRRTALAALRQQKRYDEALALIDLHRIALTYVTNKKGGDQVMDALETQVRREHEANGMEMHEFESELITGGIDMGSIQGIMKRAECGILAGTPMPSVTKLMRSIVATSAISHGVDVDRFNSMFFAGMPADVAEYIQASSRVGRTHVGFVILIPTPQSKRDRYIVEAHQMYHRFLERMIAAPAAERWADNALRRITASIIQAWGVLREIEQFCRLADAQKHKTQRNDIAKTLHATFEHDRIAFRDALATFMKAAVGFDGQGSDGLGKPHHGEHYTNVILKLIKDFSDALPPSAVELRELWGDLVPTQKPMTSLRDVDEAAIIVAARRDPNTNRWLTNESVERVMRSIRGQKSRVNDVDEPEIRPEEA
jgi:hypothetical protein